MVVLSKQAEQSQVATGNQQASLSVLFRWRMGIGQAPADQNPAPVMYHCLLERVLNSRSLHSRSPATINVKTQPLPLT